MNIQRVVVSVRKFPQLSQTCIQAEFVALARHSDILDHFHLLPLIWQGRARQSSLRKWNSPSSGNAPDA
jgi:hypothetical protein